ncbi:hypothetical protein V1517DRAFT_313313 [Lipomyces orientalis]|uniref:Uncharacterized protein n=1 Tax=Lipomyces orientalis TaxID=1233043 RepID=A0ACC3TWY7_9ASCO
MPRYERVVVIPDVKKCRVGWNRKVAKIPIGTVDVDMSIGELNRELNSMSCEFDRRSMYDQLVGQFECGKRGWCAQLELVKWLVRERVILVAYIRTEAGRTRMLIAMPATDNQLYKQVQVEDCERRRILGLLLRDLNKHSDGFDGIAEPWFEPVLDEPQAHELIGDRRTGRKCVTAAFYECCTGAPVRSATVENPEDEAAVQAMLQSGGSELDGFERACVAQMMYREFCQDEDWVDPQFVEAEAPNKETYYLHLDTGRAVQKPPRVKFVNGGIFYERCRARVMRMCMALIAARPRICEARLQSLAVNNGRGGGGGGGVASLAESCSLAVKRATVYWQDMSLPGGCAQIMRDQQCCYSAIAGAVYTTGATLVVCQDELYNDWQCALDGGLDGARWRVFGVSHVASLPAVTELVKFDVVLIRESYFCREAMQGSASPISRIHWRRIILESPVGFNNWWRQTLGQVKCVRKDVLWIVGALGMQGIRPHDVVPVDAGLDRPADHARWRLGGDDEWDVAHFEPMEATIAAMVEQGSRRAVTMDLWPGVMTRWVGEDAEILAARIERDLRALMPHYEPPVV